MNKKVLGIVVALMAVAMLATPVMAVSPNKVPVEAFITGISYFGDVEIRVTDDGIVHIENLRMEGTIVIIVDGDVANPINVDWIDDPCEGLYNPRTDKSVYTFDEIWSIDGVPAFVGTDHVKIDGDIFTTYTGLKTHIVLHGIGAYEGQVLNLKMNTEETAGFIGTWLKP